MITSLYRQNDAIWRNYVKMTSFWRNNDVIIVWCVCWVVMLIFTMATICAITNLYQSQHGVSPSANFHIFCFKTLLTRRDRVTYMYASENWVMIGSDNGLSPIRHQVIISTNAGISLIRSLGSNISLNGKSYILSTKMHLKMSSGRRRPFCLGLNVQSHDALWLWSYVRSWQSSRRFLELPTLKRNCYFDKTFLTDYIVSCQHPDNKVHGANMGPIWGRQDPGGPHVGPMNFAIWAWKQKCHFD